MTLLFFMKKSKKTIDGTARERRVELSAKKSIDFNKWNSAAQKVLGSTEEVKKIKAYLKTLEHDIYEAHQQLVQEGK